MSCATTQATASRIDARQGGGTPYRIDLGWGTPSIVFLIATKASLNLEQPNLTVSKNIA